MSHITLEHLARLVEERPGPEEAEHLEQCATCRAELHALREQTDALQDLPDIEPAPEAWPELRDALRSEGLVRGTAARGPKRAVVWRAAASVALFLVGGLSGFALRGADAGQTVGPPVAATEPAEVQTVDDAARWLQNAENDYLAALSRYTELTDGATSDPATRLAALENIVLTTREALNETPADPVINGYHLTAVAQRDAMLRQISNTSPNAWF